MTLTEFNFLATRKLDFEIIIKHPYKICELKPAYGLIFDEYLKEYNFWGYGDIDLVYGNIEKFLPADWHNLYDIIAFHNRFIPGHFCLLRNNNVCKNLFRESKNYKRIFQSPVYHGFDEILNPFKVMPGKYTLYLSKMVRTNCHIAITAFVKMFRESLFYGFYKRWKKLQIPAKHASNNDFTSIVYWNWVNKKLNVWQQLSFEDDLMFRKTGIRVWDIEWNHGTLIDRSNGKEIIYFHFSLSKSNFSFYIDTFNESRSRFHITQTGIK
jgi:hypothetical protein